MAFDIITFLTSIFVRGLNVPGLDEKATAWLAEKGAEYPDIKDRADALATYLHDTLTELAPELDPDKMRNTLIGIARDVVSGAAGVDHGAWHGMV